MVAAILLTESRDKILKYQLIALNSLFALEHCKRSFHLIKEMHFVHLLKFYCIEMAVISILQK